METDYQKMTERTETDYCDFVMDGFGGQYSPDGKRLISVHIGFQEEYSIREGTEVICNRAFEISSFNYLKKLIIPKSVKAIGKEAFMWFYGVEVECHSPRYIVENNLLIDNVNREIVGYFGAKDEDIVIPETIKSVGSAFWNSSIKQITLPNSITSIEAETFEFCSMLQKVTIPDSITSIGDRAFDECGKLKKIDIPKTVKSIGKEAFMWCGLRSLIIPNGVKSIGDGAFVSCGLLESITLPNSLVSIGSNPFALCDKVRIKSRSRRFVIENEMLIDSNNGRLITYFGNAEHVYVPNSVKTIGAEAFNYYPIKQITLPPTLESIEKDVFYLYGKLEKITIRGRKANEIKQMLPEEWQKIADVQING